MQATAGVLRHLLDADRPAAASPLPQPENDPEGAVLALIGHEIPEMRQLVEQAASARRQDPAILLDLGLLSERQQWVLAMAYNNLMAHYLRGRVRSVSSRRFLVPVATGAYHSGMMACEAHRARILAKHIAASGRFCHYVNDYTLEEPADGGDRNVAFLPHNAYLREIIFAFEAFVGYRKTLRVCDVEGVEPAPAAATADDAPPRLHIVDRQFLTVQQYRDAVAGYDAEVAQRHAACQAPVYGCAQCFPCTATACLSLYPREKFKMPYLWRMDDSSSIVMPTWYGTRAVMAMENAWHPTASHRTLDERRRAVLWFFAGVDDPLGTLFRVAQSLRFAAHGDVRPIDRVLTVQAVAVRAAERYRDDAAGAKRVQSGHVLPALRAGRLYDPVGDATLSQCHQFCHAVDAAPSSSSP